MGEQIKVLNEDIRIRPSAIDGFYGCAFQWGKVFLEGHTSIPNSRAAIGTAIHAAAETGWQESMAKKEKIFNQGAILDAAMEAWKEETKNGISYGKDETEKSCTAEIYKGTEAFVEDVVPFSAIPIAVENFYKVDIDHVLVSELGGTVDYETEHTIADIKTGKRKPSVSNYSTQQSIYTFLAKQNGRDIKNNIIQSVVLKKEPEGSIIPMPVNIEEAKDYVNMMLDTLDLVMKDVAPIETILRPNPKYMFCSQAYCAFYGQCPGTKQRELFSTTVMPSAPAKKGPKL